MPELLEETIAAVATPPGRGGISIVRVSGPKALWIFSCVFVSPHADFVFKPRYLHYGHVYFQGEVLDEVLAVCMPGPKTVTGEDVVEFQCHGGPALVAGILESVLQAGARPAAPGEFTKRAFLNGRINLSQAEAVGELIAAASLQGARFAAAKLSGAFAARIETIRNNLDQIRMRLLLALDFPEEESEFMEGGTFSFFLKAALDAAQCLSMAFERARMWREGAAVVLLGCVNAGKSSLFNALLGRSRALVSSSPGTTRDYLEEAVNLRGLPVRLFDTAGLRYLSDLPVEPTEAEGIACSYQLAQEADLLLLVVDAFKTDLSVEKEFLRRTAVSVPQNRLLVVLNKVDLCGSLPDSSVWHPYGTVLVSAKDGSGLDDLCETIRSLLVAGRDNALPADSAQSDLAPNIRQAHLLGKAVHCLKQLEKDFGAELPAEILAQHLAEAIAFLDEVTGSTEDEELLDRIFSSFCIGK